jgi:hypothetical protein
MADGSQRQTQKRVPEQHTKDHFDGTGDREPEQTPVRDGDGLPGSEKTTLNESWEEFKGLVGRLLLFLVTVASIGLDLLFVLAWVWLHVQAHHYIESIGKLGAISGTIAIILEVAFNIATALIVLSYVAHDLYVSVRRHWKGGSR